MASNPHGHGLLMCAAIAWAIAMPGIPAAGTTPEPNAADSVASAATAKVDSTVAVEAPLDAATVTTDSTTIADSTSGDVTIVTTVTTMRRVKRAAIPAPAPAADSLVAIAAATPVAPELELPDSIELPPVPAASLAPVSLPAEPVTAAAPAPPDSVAPVAPAVAAVAAEPAKPAPALPAGPRIALISNGADPLLVDNVKRMLEKSGASVDVLPIESAAASATLASPAPAQVNAAPAALAGPVPQPARVAGPGAASAPATLPIAWEGQMRYRYEARTLQDYRLPGTFGRAATQSLSDRGDLSIMRTRVGATVRMAPLVRGYFVLQDARTMGAEGSPSGTLQNVDLYHAYVDMDSVGARPLHVRVGRQTFAYGEGRVIAGADWGNAGRAYDGARVRWNPARTQLDGFVAWINEGRVNGQDRLLSGVDALWKSKKGHEVEGYHFRRAFGDAAWTSETGRKGSLMDATSGARAKLSAPRFEVRAEAAAQTGQRASDAVHAWFAVARVTADLRGPWKTKLFGEYLRASGDTDPADGEFGRFDPVYWGGHNFQGALDVVAASNVRDQALGFTTTPRKGWTLQAEGHVFRLDQGRDAWLDDAGNTLRRSSAGAAGNDLGREVDVTLKWETRGKVTVLAGASRFFAGDYVRRTGGGTDLNWGFLQLAVGF